MTDTDYLRLVTEAFSKLTEMRRQRENIEVDIAKLKQFIVATANLLPDLQRLQVLANMQLVEDVERIAEAGLTEAVRNALRNHPRQWLTAAKVRDELVAASFDFSDYKSNPLASVSTTLRRMKSDEVETANVDGGVTAYRWIGPILGSFDERIAAGKKALDYWAALEKTLQIKQRRGITPPPRPDDIEDAMPFKKK